MTTSPKSTPKKATGAEAAEAKDLNLTYEDARAQLEQVVRELEQQNVSLESSMELWQRGEELAKICEAWLSGARKKLADAVAARSQDQA